MTYTSTQLDALRPYEGYFRTAIDGSWCRYPGSAALRIIHQAFTSATGDRRRLVSSCSVCVLHLIQDAGRLYFADLAEIQQTLQAKAEKPAKRKQSSKK